MSERAPPIDQANDERARTLNKIEIKLGVYRETERGREGEGENKEQNYYSYNRGSCCFCR